MVLMSQQQNKRFPAIKISINNLKKADITKEKDFIGLSFNNKSLVRVNLIGLVVSVDETGFLLDDGSNNVFCRFFDFFPKKKLSTGELILVIGKPRIFEKQIYVSCEVVRVLEDFSWFKLRELELGKEKNTNSFSEKSISRVYSALKELDGGFGVDELQLKTYLGYDAKLFIETLIKNGDVFQVKNGKFKVLG